MVRRKLFVGAIAFLLAAFLLTHSFAVAQASSSIAKGRGGAVASVDRQATEIGINVLKAGGNAIDAAVATAAALGVTEPFSAGIGGGGFMLIYLGKEHQVIALDGREQAPASVTANVFQDPDSPTNEPLPFFPNRISSGVAVGVPGTLLTWTEALNRYGTLSIEEALAPAIALAQDGFKVDATFAKQTEENQARFAAFTSTRKLYLPNGKPPQVGSTFKNPDLAKTYRSIAQQGANLFYRGELGRAIAQTVQNPPTVPVPPFRVVPGGMTIADLDQYAIQIRPATTSTYRGYKLYGMGLPSSGGITTSEVLNIISGFDLAKLNSAQAWHTVIEAERLAFADRNAYLGDPEFVDVPVAGLLSAAFTQTRQTEISNRAPAKDFKANSGDPLPHQLDPSPSLTRVATTAATQDVEGLSTTHLSVSDQFGNVVSYTLTIEAIGGSGIVVPGHGFILNNELTDFDTVTPHPNVPEAGKRPRSSMAPTIAVAPDGRIMAIGSPGGSTIITTVLGIEVNLIDFGMSLEEAIAAPRISQRNGGVTQVDHGFETTETGQELKALGHVLEPVSEIGAATGIIVNSNGTMIAAAEPKRRGGGSAMTMMP